MIPPPTVRCVCACWTADGRLPRFRAAGRLGWFDESGRVLGGGGGGHLTGGVCRFGSTVPLYY